MTEGEGLSEQDLRSILDKPSVKSRATDVGQYGPDEGAQTRRIQEAALEGISVDLLPGVKRLAQKLFGKNR